MAVAARPRLVELALGGYAAIVGVTALTRLSLSPGNALVALGHALVVVLMVLVIMGTSRIQTLLLRES